MKRVLSWVFGIPVAIILIAFAIANRKSIVVSFDPFSIDAPWLTLSMPVWALVYAGIFVGLVAGGIAAWLKQGKWRKIGRQTRSELETVRSENEHLKGQLTRSDMLLTAKDEKMAS